MSKIIEEPAASSPVWETLETYAREQIQQFVQRLLEEEVDALLGRTKSERRTDVTRSAIAMATASHDSSRSPAARSPSSGPGCATWRSGS